MDDMQAVTCSGHFERLAIVLPNLESALTRNMSWVRPCEAPDEPIRSISRASKAAARPGVRDRGPWQWSVVLPNAVFSNTPVGQYAVSNDFLERGW